MRAVDHRAGQAVRNTPQECACAHPSRRVRRLAFALGSASMLVLAGAFPAAAQDSAQLLIASQAQPHPADTILIAPRQEKPVDAASDGSALDPVQTAALYYYAKQRQTERVEAEIARLQALHPGFVPPHDLYLAEEAAVPDETSLWEMFAADDFTGIDAEIIRRRAEDASWQPTADFQGKLIRKKLRVRMTELSQAEDWRGLIGMSSGIDPATETDVDLIWMRTDALSAVGDRDGLAHALRGLLARAGTDRLSDENLVVTLQKALKDFPVSEIRILSASLWPNQPQDYLPGPLRLDVARKQIAQFNSTKDAVAVSEVELELLSDEAKKSRKPEDLSLLGWYSLKIEKPAQAEQWFAIAMQGAPGPEVARGMYLSLYRQDDGKRAYAFAVEHLEALSDDPVFLMNVLSPRFGEPDANEMSEEAVRAYSTAILETSAADHAEILGWYAYNSQQFEAAEAWFRQSYGWEASADRVKGLALSLVRRGQKKDYAALKKQLGEVYPDIWAEITAAQAPKARKAASVSEPRKGVKTSYVRHLTAKNYSSCLREIDRLGQAANKPSVTVIRGWCELGLKRFGAARSSFERAMAGTGQVRSDAIYGAALSLLGARLTDEAEALVAASSLSQARERELKSEIYVQRAQSTFENKQYGRTLTALDARAALVAEPRDLTQLRAWAHYHLGQTGRAKAIFRQLNLVIRDSGSVAAAAIVNK